MTYDDIMPEGNPYCNSMSYACQLNSNIPSSLVGEYMSGSTDGVTTTIHITGGDLCFEYGTFSQLTIELTCGPDIGTPVFMSEIDCHYFVSWQSSAACPRTAFPTLPRTPFPPDEASYPIDNKYGEIIRRAEYSFWLADSPIESIFVDIVTSDNNEPVLNMHRNMECTPRPKDGYFNCGGEIMGGDGNIVVSIDDVAAMQVYAKLYGSSEVYLTGDVDFLPTTNTLLASMTNAPLAIVRALTDSLLIVVEHAKEHMVLYIAANSSTHAFLEIKDYVLQVGPDPPPGPPDPVPTNVEPEVPDDWLSQGAKAGIVIAMVAVVAGGIAVGLFVLVQRYRRKSYKQLDGGENATIPNAQGDSSPVQQDLDESTPVRAEQGETYQATTSTVPAAF